METKTFELNLTGLTQAQIDSIKSQIEKFEEENSVPKKLSDEVLMNGFILFGDVAIVAKRYGEITVKGLYSIGLWRPTREECEKLLKKMQIAERLRQWSLMCEEKVDWSNSNQLKYYMYYGTSTIQLIKDYVTSRSENSIYFTDKSILERAIADIGEKKLIEEYFVEV